MLGLMGRGVLLGLVLVVMLVLLAVVVWRYGSDTGSVGPGQSGDRRYRQSEWLKGVARADQQAGRYGDVEFGKFVSLSGAECVGDGADSLAGLPNYVFGSIERVVVGERGYAYVSVGKVPHSFTVAVVDKELFRLVDEKLREAKLGRAGVSGYILPGWVSGGNQVWKRVAVCHVCQQG